MILQGGRQAEQKRDEVMASLRASEAHQRKLRFEVTARGTPAVLLKDILPQLLVGFG